MTERACACCRLVQPLEAFYVDRAKPLGRTYRCKVCVRVAQKRLSQSPSSIAAQAAKMRKRNYGITSEQYQAFLVDQGGVCAICQRPEDAKHKGSARSLSVDHDHGTGRIRGLLCRSCNAGIGFLNDDANLLARAIKYLISG